MTDHTNTSSVFCVLAVGKNPVKFRLSYRLSWLRLM